MTYIRYWEDPMQKKDFIVFCDKRSSFLSRNIQNFKTILTIDGICIYFLWNKIQFWNKANHFHSLFPPEIPLTFGICVHEKKRTKDFIPILNAKPLKQNYDSKENFFPEFCPRRLIAPHDKPHVRHRASINLFSWLCPDTLVVYRSHVTPVLTPQFVDGR